MKRFSRALFFFYFAATLSTKLRQKRVGQYFDPNDNLCHLPYLLLLPPQIDHCANRISRHLKWRQINLRLIEVFMINNLLCLEGVIIATDFFLPNIPTVLCSGFPWSKLKYAYGMNCYELLLMIINKPFIDLTCTYYTRMEEAHCKYRAITENQTFFLQQKN